MARASRARHYLYNTIPFHPCMDPETILICGAHADDPEIAMGGTLAKYANEGKRVITVIFSFGEKSSPWLKEDILIMDRKKEAKEIGAFLGSAETIFLGLNDTKISDEVNNPKIRDLLKKIIKRYNPAKIFTHSEADHHAFGDHQAVHKLVMKALDEIDKNHTIGVYSFEVWNLVNEDNPILYVDVTKTFGGKIEAMRKFKSQKASIYTLMIPVIIRAVIAGFHAKCRFAERFYKIR